jgi:hypothetical protein
MANDKAARLATALRASADHLRQHLPGGDTQLVSINDHEAAMLRQMGGSGKRDPITGVISFDEGSDGPNGANGNGGGTGGGTGGSNGDPSGGAGNGNNGNPDPGMGSGAMSGKGDTSPSGANGGKSGGMGGETGTGHGLGESSAFSGMAGGFGQPDLGTIGNAAVNGIANNMGTLSGAAMGALTGGLPGAVVGGLLGAAGVPGVGNVVGAMGAHGVSTGNQAGVGPGIGGSFGAPTVGQSPNQALAQALRG